jgi:hypothetical protein
MFVGDWSKDELGEDSSALKRHGRTHWRGANGDKLKEITRKYKKRRLKS